jgi:D-erythro-7,8-dihydroneopterin triphosphate epimerase
MSELYSIDTTTISIKNLKLRTIIGFNEWERDQVQEVIVNISIVFDPSEAIRTDAAADTIDYKKLKGDIITLVEHSSFFLLEKLAAAIVACIMHNPLIAATSVKVDKPHALRFTDSVAVEMHATRHA